MVVTRILLCLLCIGGVSCQTAHTQCSYVADNLFTCDYSAMPSSSDRPIDYTSFSPEPQCLEVTVNGFVPYYGDSQVFSETFSNIQTAQFDTNYPASLTLDCGRGGGIYINTGAFANMSYVQHFKIRNCKIYDIPASAFEDFENLDYFGIENGFIDNVDPNAWLGLNVEKLTSGSHTFPRFLGKFEVLYTAFPTTYVPPGLLYNMKNLTSATLRGAGISQLASDVFKYNTKIKYIDVGDNDFTNIPTGLFDNLDSLSEFRAQNIIWACSCSNIWFVPYSVSHNITFIGAFVCSSGVGVFEYYYKNCALNDVCGDKTGFVLGKLCIGPLAIIILILSCAALGMVIFAMVTVLLIKRGAKQAEAKKRQAIGRWNQIIDSTIAWRKR